MKFNKCCLQLGAYALGIEQTLNMKVQQAAILVSTEQGTQLFKITRNHLNSSQDKWLKVVNEYYTSPDREEFYDPGLI